MSVVTEAHRLVTDERKTSANVAHGNCPFSLTEIEPNTTRAEAPSSVRHLSLIPPPSPPALGLPLPRRPSPPCQQTSQATSSPLPTAHSTLPPPVSEQKLTRNGASAKPASPRINSPSSNGDRELSGLSIARYHDRPLKAIESPRDPGKPPTKKRTCRVSVMAINRREQRWCLSVKSSLCSPNGVSRGL